MVVVVMRERGGEERAECLEDEVAVRRERLECFTTCCVTIEVHFNKRPITSRYANYQRSSVVAMQRQ